MKLSLNQSREEFLVTLDFMEDQEQRTELGRLIINNLIPISFFGDICYFIYKSNGDGIGCGYRFGDENGNGCGGDGNISNLTKGNGVGYGSNVDANSLYGGGRGCGCSGFNNGDGGEDYDD